MALCLFAAGALVAVLQTEALTLSWTHSVERTLWEERWRVDGDRLLLEEAAVAGSGAGMEPAAGAVLRDGRWRFRPELPPLAELVLAASPAAGDYTLCWNAGCRPLAMLVPPDGPATLKACSS